MHRQQEHLNNIKFYIFIYIYIKKLGLGHTWQDMTDIDRKFKHKRDISISLIKISGFNL